MTTPESAKALRDVLNELRDVYRRTGNDSAVYEVEQRLDALTQPEGPVAGDAVSQQIMLDAAVDAFRREQDAGGSLWECVQEAMRALHPTEARATPEDGRIREGCIVQWRSQAQGHAKTKIGTVREVVQAGNRPDRIRFASLYKGAGVGFGRKDESYVVEVAGRYYWPHANKLRLISAMQADSTEQETP